MSYYLQLLAAFAHETAGMGDARLANEITTGLIVAIGLIGTWQGLDELEKFDQFAVSLNLGIILVLLVSLMVYNAKLALAGEWVLAELPVSIDYTDLRVLLGLLIVVQGFETSRYLGEDHPPEQRVRTMKRAQGISSVIYILFLLLVTVLFREGLGGDFTAIITMAAPVGAVLPLLLTIGVAALLSARNGEGVRGHLRTLSFLLLALVSARVFAIGLPSE
ncbi:MAG: hypothetical protein HRT34_14000 [Alcanivorax sp.]|nr:hypothetical protein [Alcanivorax sp.]